MLDYALQRAIDTLRPARWAILVTNGPAGVQAGEIPCEAAGLDIYLLAPRTSDHLFNLEHNSSIILLTNQWEVTGEAHLILAPDPNLNLDLLNEPCAQWCHWVRVIPARIQIRKETGWGYLETIDL